MEGEGGGGAWHWLRIDFLQKSKELKEAQQFRISRPPSPLHSLGKIVFFFMKGFIGVDCFGLFLFVFLSLVYLDKT